MVIFGGFSQGTRTNEVAIFNIQANNWVNVKFPRGEALPCPRSGHSASIYNGQMFIFGGKDEESEKLNDLWCYNVAEQFWLKIQVEDESLLPIARSGHTSDVYNGYLVLFGGIKEVTKELNDLSVFSFEKNVWTLL